MGVEPRTTGGLLPSFCVESPQKSSVGPALSPAATVVCKDVDAVSDETPEFRLSQCFGDCSPAEEATQGENTQRQRNIIARLVLQSSKCSQPLTPCIVSHCSVSAIVPNSAQPAADILSAVHFDPSGEYLATGDRGGRVVIFKKSDGGKSKVRRCYKGKA